MLLSAPSSVIPLWRDIHAECVRKSKWLLYEKRVVSTTLRTGTEFCSETVLQVVPIFLRKVLSWNTLDANLPPFLSIMVTDIQKYAILRVYTCIVIFKLYVLLLNAFIIYWVSSCFIWIGWFKFNDLLHSIELECRKRWTGQEIKESGSDSFTILR
jgi:hypothetical protein